MKRLFLVLICCIAANYTFSQTVSFLEGKFNPECDACSITFSKDMTFKANINSCDKYEDISGSYKIDGINVMLTTKDYENAIMFTLSEEKDQLTQTRLCAYGCDNCFEGTPWVLFPGSK